MAFLIIAYLVPILVLPTFLIPMKIKKTNYLKKFSKKFKSNKKEQTLKRVYNFVNNNYTEERMKFITEFYKLFYINPEKILRRKQFLPCHMQNYLLTTLLINTKQFNKSQIKKYITVSNLKNIIHQYLIVSTNKKKYKVDVFYKTFKQIK